MTHEPECMSHTMPFAPCDCYGLRVAYQRGREDAAFAVGQASYYDRPASWREWGSWGRIMFVYYAMRAARGGKQV